jgi:hypothetical protein
VNIFLCRDSFIFTMQFTMLYDFYHYLILKEVSFWQWKYCRRCYRDFLVSSCRSEVMFFSKYST